MIGWLIDWLIEWLILGGICRLWQEQGELVKCKKKSLAKCPHLVEIAVFLFSSKLIILKVITILDRKNTTMKNSKAVMACVTDQTTIPKTTQSPHPRQSSNGASVEASQSQMRAADDQWPHPHWAGARHPLDKLEHSMMVLEVSAPTRNRGPHPLTHSLTRLNLQVVNLTSHCTDTSITVIKVQSNLFIYWFPTGWRHD